MINSVFFPLLVLFIAFITAKILYHVTKQQISLKQSRYETIDGLRGFLAICVFITHACIWYGFLHKGTWSPDNISEISRILGPVPVSFFFMITSFLFFSKLVNDKDNIISWGNFFISRFFRLFPLYWFSMFLIFLIAMFSTHWQLKTNVYDFIFAILSNLSLNMVNFNSPQTWFNGFYNTYLVNSWVTWSLRYEIVFYIALPCLALGLQKKKPNWVVVLVSSMCLVFFIYKMNISKNYLFIFLGGSIGVFINKIEKVQILLKKNYFSLIALIILLYIFKTTSLFFSFKTILLESIFFTIIACGNSIFKLLYNPVLKFMGEISYSTYLLHGIVLYITFNYIIGINEIKKFSDIQYCYVIFLLTIIVVLLSYLGYTFIEKPFIDYNKKGYLKQQKQCRNIKVK